MSLDYGGSTLMNPDIMEAFTAFTMGINGSLAANVGMLDYDRFLHSQNIYCFNFSENQFSPNTVSASVNEQESLLIDFQFNTGPTTNYSLICIVVTENCVTYHVNKQVTLDFVPGLVS